MTKNVETVISEMEEYITSFTNDHRLLQTNSISGIKYYNTSRYAEELKSFDKRINLAKQTVLNLIRKMDSGEFTVELYDQQFSEEEDDRLKEWSKCFPSHNPGKYIIVLYSVKIITDDLSFRLNPNVDDWHAQYISYQNSDDGIGCFTGTLFNKFRGFCKQKLKSKVDKLYEDEVVPKFNKYLKAKKSRDKNFEKNAPRIAMKKISEYIHANKLNFTREELKAVIPVMIIKQQDLAMLVGWFDRNKKLRDKFTDESIEQIADNVTIMDILE